jgi:hypothetical protein
MTRPASDYPPGMGMGYSDEALRHIAAFTDDNGVSQATLGFHLMMDHGVHPETPVKGITDLPPIVHMQLHGTPFTYDPEQGADDDITEK